MPKKKPAAHSAVKKAQKRKTSSLLPVRLAWRHTHIKVVVAIFALLVLAGVFWWVKSGDAAQTTSTTYRVLIDTDLGGDPDDIQSLVRAVHYSDVLRIEGIVSSPNVKGIAGKPELIKEWIKRTDVEHLRERGHGNLMTEASLLNSVKVGARSSGAPSGTRGTEGSRHIIDRANAGNASNPLWVLVWGTMSTVAQAIHDDPSITSKIRIYSIGDFNTTGDQASRDYVYNHMRNKDPDMWWIENGWLNNGNVTPGTKYSTFRGVWNGGNQTGEWDNVTFLEQNIRRHGSTHDGLYATKTGDEFPKAEGPAGAVGALKEGDSPSMMYLLSPPLAGIGNIDNPTLESWGGQFRRLSTSNPNYYVDLNCSTTSACQATINKHRVSYLSHWKLRWDWYNGTVANPPTPPPTNALPSVPANLSAAAGDASVSLSWSASTDSDGSIAGYETRHKASSFTTWGTSSALAGTSRTISNLTNGTSYDFQVRSKDNMGAYSAWSAITAATPVAAPVSLPDVMVTNVTWSPASPSLGAPITFSATVRNQGSAATPAGHVVAVAFRVNDTVISWSDNSTTSLAAGASRTLTANGGPDGDATWTATDAGTYNVEARVNAALNTDRNFAESSTINNSLTAAMTVSSTSVDQPGDVDGNGTVNGIDLSKVLSNYGATNATKTTGDVNGDGTVNGLDLSLVLTNYGKTVVN